MRVQAIAEGYYNGLQTVGAIFSLEEKRNVDDEIVTPESQFSKKWMVELDADGNPVRGTPPEKAAIAVKADKPGKNLAEKSTPSKNDNGTDIDVLKDRLEDAQKAEDAGLDDGKANEGGTEATKEAPARRSRKVEDTDKVKDEAKEAAKEASEDADDKGDDKGSADDADGADKAPAEGETRRRRRRG